MPHSYGLRARTRHLFKKDFRKHGMPSLSTYLTTYKVGDIVDIKANGAIHKGMPFKYYHGKTGIVFNVTKSSVGVIVYKVVGSRYIEKRVNVRVEHVKHSKCRLEFLERVKRNREGKALARKNGTVFVAKRLPEQPREATVVSFENGITTIQPVPYEALV